MLSNLYWEPLLTGKLLPKELKLALSKRVGGSIVDRDYDESDLEFLDGLRIGGISGAATLMDLINKHGAVHVFERF